jgi:hypothetical protein
MPSKTGGVLRIGIIFQAADYCSINMAEGDSALICMYGQHGHIQLHYDFKFSVPIIIFFLF